MGDKREAIRVEADDPGYRCAVLCAEALNGSIIPSHIDPSCLVPDRNRTGHVRVPRVNDFNDGGLNQRLNLVSLLQYAVNYLLHLLLL